MSSAPKTGPRFLSRTAASLTLLRISTCGRKQQSWLFLPSGTRSAAPFSLCHASFGANIVQFLVCVFASLGSVLYGYDLGVIAEVIASQSFKTKFGDNDNET